MFAKDVVDDLANHSPGKEAENEAGEEVDLINMQDQED